MITMSDTFTARLAEYVQARGPEHFTVLRDGDRDLEFDGATLGVGTREFGEFLTLVAIYGTTSGKLVAVVESHSPSGKRSRAHVATDPNDVLEWLAADNKGKLGDAAKQAWAKACIAAEPLAPYLNERV